MQFAKIPRNFVLTVEEDISPISIKALHFDVVQMN